LTELSGCRRSLKWTRPAARRRRRIRPTTPLHRRDRQRAAPQQPSRRRSGIVGRMRRRRRAGGRVHRRLRRPPGSRVNPSTLGFGKYPSRDTAGLNALGAYRPVTGAANDRPTASLRGEPAPPVHRPNFSRVGPPSSINQAAAIPQRHRAQTPTRAWCATSRRQLSRKANQPAAAPLMAKRRLAPAPSKCRIVAECGRAASSPGRRAPGATVVASGFTPSRGRRRSVLSAPTHEAS